MKRVEGQQLTDVDDLLRQLTEPEQLQHVDRMAKVGRLAAGIIHELGTPLNVVGSYAQMIATEEVTGEEAIRAARTIEDQVRRMTSTIRQLLNFARKGAAKRAPVELAELARQTALLLAPLTSKVGVRVTVVAPEAACFFVQGLEGPLQQILVNLITNAMHAMPRGGEITVEVGRVTSAVPGDPASEEREWIRVSVRDHGVGIAEETRSHLFEPFFTTKEIGKGTGLGLSVCAEIAREHGGWMEVESQQGQGSCFSLVLPERRGAQTS